MSPSVHPKDDADLDLSISPSTVPPLPFFARHPTSPVRFATTTNAFGLAVSPISSSSSPSTIHINGSDTSPPITITAANRRLRRPSMLSLAQTASFASESSLENEDTTATGPGPPEMSMRVQDPSSSRTAFSQHQPSPMWGAAAFPSEALRRTASAPPDTDNLSSNTRMRTPPNLRSQGMERHGSGSGSGMELEMELETEVRDSLRWMPNHLHSSSRHKGKARMDEGGISHQPHPAALHAPPFTGRPLPTPLLATLLAESSPLEHEMQSEARLQRLLSSHPKALPFTPRPTRSSRGRFPEMVGGDDDDDDEDSRMRRPSWARTSWMKRASSSDSDPDDMPEDPPEPVNAAFASGMDMDRPTSSSSSCVWVESGKSTPGQSRSNSGSVVPNLPTPPLQSVPWTGGRNMRMSFGSAGAGMVPSPGSGLTLPGAFGGLGMGGIGTPMGSPTIERLELAGSPAAGSVSSPGLMQYRDPPNSSTSIRPGKRKAQAEDRYDPYKRPRDNSPVVPMSPSRTTSAITIPQSPGRLPLYPSALSTSGPSSTLSSRHTKLHNHNHNLNRRSRSRAASPALSVSSTSGISSAGPRTSFGLGQAFVPVGNSNGNGNGHPQSLGGLGLLNLRNGIGSGNPGERKSGDETQEEDERDCGEKGVVMAREDSGESREAMEED